MMANVMFGIASMIAFTVQMGIISVFISGLGLMILHAFGIIAPPF